MHLHLAELERRQNPASAPSANASTGNVAEAAEAAKAAEAAGSAAICRPRCVCDRGLVRLGVEGGGGGGGGGGVRCVRPSQCPCHHAGRSFEHGQIIRRPNECKTW